MEPLSRKRPKERVETEAKVCHRMHDIRSFLHKADNQSAPPTLVSRHDTQRLLAVALAAPNDDTDIAQASKLPPKSQSSNSSIASSSSFLPISISETSEDDDTPLEVNHEAEVLIAITPCPRAVVSQSVSSAMVLPANDVGLVKVGTVLPSNVLLDLLMKHVTLPSDPQQPGPAHRFEKNGKVCQAFFPKAMA